MSGKDFDQQKKLKRKGIGTFECTRLQRSFAISIALAAIIPVPKSPPIRFALVLTLCSLFLSLFLLRFTSFCRLFSLIFIDSHY